MDGTGYRVLVVDDDPNVCELIAEILSSRKYEVVRAHSYHEAVLLLRNQHEFHAITTDYRLESEKARTVPYTGIDLIRFVKAKCLVPVIMISGTVAMGDAAIQAGAVTFVAKPFDAEILLSIMYAATHHSVLIEVNNSR